MPSGPGALSRMWRRESTWVPMWSPITMRQWAVSQSTPNLAAPTRSANCCHVSYITSAGRTTRGKLTMSLCTGMLKSISLAINLLCSRDPSVQVQRLAGHEVRCARSKEHDRPGHVVRLRDPPQRYPRHEPFVKRRICQHVGDEIRPHECRRDHVHIDFVRRPFRGQLLAEDHQ